ncbi:hypothetical protein AOQ84DRAFT_419661 [Glonium stellatum]|uniref:Uncharacterized protein n=1 Tax=Glonium stellatum TaxID=574774 RepID=A0A8E2ER10_9PEZI|nr:hypothetical protein AOQ84DRAFT_419661 [Glonium stellatum]
MAWPPRRKARMLTEQQLYGQRRIRDYDSSEYNEDIYININNATDNRRLCDALHSRALNQGYDIMLARSQIPAHSTQGVTFFFIPSMLTNGSDIMGYMHETPTTDTAYFFPCSLSLEEMQISEPRNIIDSQFYPGNGLRRIVSKMEDPECHRSVYEAVDQALQRQYPRMVL